MCDIASLSKHNLEYANDGEHIITIGDAANWLDDAIEACVERMREGDKFELLIPVSTLDNKKYVIDRSPIESMLTDKLCIDDHVVETDKTALEMEGSGAQPEACDNDPPGVANSNATTSEQTEVDKCSDCTTDCRPEDERSTKPIHTTHYVLQLRLLSFIRQPDVWTVCAEDKLESASHYKHMGSLLYKRGQVEWAFRHFSKALKHLILIGPSLSDDVPVYMQPTYKTLKSQCYANIAACQLQRSNFPAVVTNCTKALALQADQVKALYRRAQAFVGLHDHDNAAADLKRAQQIEPVNSAVSQLLTTVQQLRTEENRSMAKAMSKMFAVSWN